MSDPSLDKFLFVFIFNCLSVRTENFLLINNLYVFIEVLFLSVIKDIIFKLYIPLILSFIIEHVA